MSIDREAVLKKAEKLLRQGKLTGAIEEIVRLVEVQPRDVGARNALGDLYVRAGDTDRAVAEFTRAADQLFTDGFLPRAQATYKKALKVQAHHEHALSQLAEISCRQNLVADATGYLRQLAERRRLRGDEAGVAECQQRLLALEQKDSAWLSSESQPPAGAVPDDQSEDPVLLLEAASKALASGNELQGRVLLMRALAADTGRHGDVVKIALELTAQGRIETAFGCVDVAADAALLSGNWTQAIEALQTFVRAAPHIPALVKLVELCVDARLDGPLRSAQTQLADAYLDIGKGAEARVIAEDLLEHDPDSEAHAQRVRRAIELLGAFDGDSIVAGLRGRHRVLDEPDTDVVESLREPEIRSGFEEIDLTHVLAVIGEADEASPEDVVSRGLRYMREGRIEEGIADLQEAAGAPQTSARATIELGRWYLERGEWEAAVEWLERAADGPANTLDEGLAVLYELAGALERLGQPARALAILVELDADSGGYRDVRTRIEQLARLQAGGEQP